MRVLINFVGIACLAAVAQATPYGSKEKEKRQFTGNGCINYDCTTGTWPVDPSCATGEYSAVASSLLNPPPSVSFDGVAFCSAMLQPVLSDVSTTEVPSAGTLTVTSTGEYVIWSFVTHTHHHTTKTSSPSPYKTSSAMITATPMPRAVEVEKRDFTVPAYLEEWYFYGRLDPACSCIITSAAPYTITSSTETDSMYNATVNAAITETYYIVTSVDSYEKK